jgi:hypothetical protein
MLGTGREARLMQLSEPKGKRDNATARQTWGAGTAHTGSTPALFWSTVWGYYTEEPPARCWNESLATG